MVDLPLPLPVCGDTGTEKHGHHRGAQTPVATWASEQLAEAATSLRKKLHDRKHAMAFSRFSVHFLHPWRNSKSNYRHLWERLPFMPNCHVVQ